MTDRFAPSFAPSTSSSTLRAGTLQHLYVLPVGHLQLRRIILVEIEDHELLELAGCTARFGHSLSVLLPQQTLQKRMVMRRIIAWRAATLAITGIEALRIHDEVEALQILEHHRQLVSATFFVVVAFAFTTSTFVQRHQLFGSGSLPPVADRRLR